MRTSGASGRPEPRAASRGTPRAPVTGMSTFPAATEQKQKGDLLVEALCALALVGLIVAGGASMVHVAAQLSARNASFDAGLDACRGLQARLEGVSFARLPELFGAPPSARAAVLDTADGSAPAEWAELAARLPAGSLRATLEGVGAGGGAAPFDAAVALRVTARAAWDDGPRTRTVELVHVRF